MIKKLYRLFNIWVNGTVASCRLRGRGSRSCPLLFAIAASFLLCPLCVLQSEAIALDPGERIHLRMVSPIENNTGFRVWGSRHYPGDVLPEKMSDYFFRKLNVIPRLSASRLDGRNPQGWSTSGFSRGDMIIKLNLEQFNYKKSDRAGSKLRWDIRLHMYVYSGSDGSLLFDSVIEERDERHYVLYNDTLETEPVYWDVFAKTVYWSAMCKALDEALSEVTDGYNGFRIVGQIVAKAERVDGSLTVPKKKQDRLYHVNLGRNETIKVGDVLAVTRSSSVRTVTPETAEMHFPQVVGRVRVMFIKDEDAVVEVIKESGDAPIQLGDAVSAPLVTRRDIKSTTAIGGEM